MLDTPGEPDESFKETIQHPAYRAQELGGLIFAYLGPEPAPLLPRLHFLAAPGSRLGFFQGFENVNFMQGVENGIDPLHTSFLHGDVWEWLSATPDDTHFDPVIGHTSTGPIELGICYKAHRPAMEGQAEDFRVHTNIMPGISGGSNDVPGFEYPAPDESFRAFEAEFPYEETPDQAKAIDDVLADMGKEKPIL